MIRSRARLAVPYTSEAFPAGTIANGAGHLVISWAELLWAALTIGRPSVHHVFQHGTQSLDEANFRLSLVRMALDQSGPRASRLRRSAAFKALDPTEKGAISYFLGMAFCKVFSSRLLQTPWLLHLDVFKSTIPTSVLGRSRPDLFGQQSGTGQWLSFETKGRASKPSSTDLAKAKTQASRLVSVNGTSCSLHVGSFTYFVNDALHFHWIDPPAETKRAIFLPEPGDAWRYYYGPARALWGTLPEGGKRETDGFVLPLPQFDLTLKVHPLLSPFFRSESWESAQRELLDLADLLKADGFQADGLKVECGPSWLEHFENDRSAG